MKHFDDLCELYWLDVFLLPEIISKLYIPIYVV